jgi:hypothetical protein
MTSSSTREPAVSCRSEPAPFAYPRDQQGRCARVDVRCGYVEGRNLVIEFRYERVPELAAEQVRLPVEGAALLR